MVNCCAKYIVDRFLNVKDSISSQIANMDSFYYVQYGKGKHPILKVNKGYFFLKVHKELQEVCAADYKVCFIVLLLIL